MKASPIRMTTGMIQTTNSMAVSLYTARFSL